MGISECTTNRSLQTTYQSVSSAPFPRQSLLKRVAECEAPIPPKILLLSLLTRALRRQLHCKHHLASSDVTTRSSQPNWPEVQSIIS